MTTRTVVACLLAASLAACAQAPTQPTTRAKAADPAPAVGKLDKAFAPTPLSAGVCHKAICQIPVEVGNQGGACTPKLDDLTIVTRRGVEVQWIITTPGWIWPQREGVKFKRTGQPFGTGRRDSDVQWSTRNNAATRGIWDYGVKLVNEKDGRECFVDPGLVTDWSTDPPPP